MKKTILISAAFAYCILLTAYCFSQGTAINSTGAEADNSAGLDVNFDNKGMLIPRLTSLQRNSINSPAHALLIFNTTTDCYEGYNSNLGQWVSFGCIGCQLPGTFISTAAGNITGNSFSANWAFSTGATNYYLDVSTDAAFSSYVTGFNNLSAGNVLTTSVTGLTCGTTYYYRVRAGNSCGTGTSTNVISAATTNCFVCGNPLTDTRDNRTYNTVTIGSQCWLQENLNYGNMINASSDQANNSIPEKYCYYNDTNYCNIYGGVYQWGEIAEYLNGASNTTSWNPVPAGNVQGLCPSGWHLPSHDELTTLERAVCAIAPSAGNCVTNFPYDYSTVGWLGTNEDEKFKTAGTGSPPQWISPSVSNNNSGFSAKPSGGCDQSKVFANLGEYFIMWSISEYSSTYTWVRILNCANKPVYRDYYGKSNGFSVRCIKD